ncbi:MAG: ATP-binding protein [Candidatus Binatia bacterium]|nr:ATP-binding protein [Candidatus Binatia bacterium]
MRSEFGGTPALGPENIQLLWLARLRWLALTGQLLVVTGIEALLSMALPWVALGIVFGVEAASNLLCTWFARRRPVNEWWLVSVLAVDMVLLTALLHMTGGPVNPFSFLYLVHIALAAVTLRQLAAWGLTALGLIGFGLLFVLPPWPGFTPPAAHHDHLWLHLQGMYVAFGISAVFIVYFVQRVREALAQRERELAAARDLAARQARFAALATMAAGAAHELGTPLSTIAVAARELEKALRDAPEEAAADIRLIRQQVRRCQTILQQMASEAGQGFGENMEMVSLAEFAAAIEEGGATQGAKIAVEVHGADTAQRIPIARQALSRAIANLLRNARQASREGCPIQVRIHTVDGLLRIEVRDHGHGMPAEVLARAGEPFFTTKPPGEGIGLGLFLTRTLVEQMGGQLELESEEGRGTTARILVPVGVRQKAALQMRNDPPAKGQGLHARETA